MTICLSKREFIPLTLGVLSSPGCSLRSDSGANLALTNSSGETVNITVEITDIGSEKILLMDSYQVPASDDGTLVQDIVMRSGDYNVGATVENTDEAASSVWRIPSGDNPENYSIRIGILSNGNLNISGDGI